MFRRKRTSSRSTGRRLSELSNTISAYALITACPAPSCRSFCRSSARSELKMSESTKRIAWNRLDLPEPFAPTVKVRKDGQRSRVSAAMVDGRGGGLTLGSSVF